MGRIQSSVGLITGIPIQDTIDKLLALAARPKQLLETRVKDLKSRKEAITQLTAMVIGVELAAQRLSNKSLFAQTKVTGSDESILSAISTGSPLVGSHQFTSVQRAQNHQLLSQGFASKTTPIGTGDVAIQFGGFVDRGVLLDELNGGAGVQRGKIKITDRSGQSATIDLRFAVKIDDVLRAINENSDISVEAVADGDHIKLIDKTGETTTNLRVQSVGATSTAADLGLDGINVAASEADGQDVLRLYGGLALQRLNDGNGVSLRTGVADLRATLQDGSVVDIDFFGLKKGPTQSAGTTAAKNGINAQIKLTSVDTGSTVDGYKLVFKDDETITSGNETVAFDAFTKTYTVKIDAGNTRAAEVIAKLNADATFSSKFTAANGDGGNGTAAVDVADTLTTSGGAIEYYNETTITDLVDTINRASPTTLQARISASGDSMELVDLTSGGGTFSVSSLFGGSVAEDLGLSTAAVGGVITGERRLAGLKTVLLDSLAGGVGIGDLGLLNVTNRSGTAASIDLSSAKTLEDVINLINDSGAGVTARINATRNGLLLTDTTSGTGNLIVANGDATNTADKLKLAANVANSTVNSGSLALQTFNESQSLASLRNGLGIGKGSFLITNSAGAVGAVNLTVLQAKTVGDVVSAINGLNLNVTAQVNETGDGLLLVDSAGGAGDLTIVDSGTGTAAKDLKIAGTSVTKDIGGVPTKLIDGSTSLRITLDANDTLQDLVTKINELGGDVTAALFNGGSGLTPHRIALSSGVSGAAGELLVDFSALNVNFQESSAAQDALLLVGSPDAAIPGAIISSSTNQFENVIDGVTLTANAASLTPQTINIEKSTDAVVSQVKLLADQYNQLREKVKEFSTFNAEANTVGVLFGSYDLLVIDLELASVLSSRFFSAGTIQSFEEVGLSPDANGELQFDEDKFRSKYAANPAAVEKFFTQENTGAAAKLLTGTKRLSGEENSTLVNRAIALQRTIDNNERQIKTITDMLARQREQMVKKFAQLEEVIARMQASLTSISRIQPIPFSSGPAR